MYSPEGMELKVDKLGLGRAAAGSCRGQTGGPGLTIDELVGSGLAVFERQADCDGVQALSSTTLPGAPSWFSSKSSTFSAHSTTVIASERLSVAEGARAV
jgi:hypothetical protein